MSRIMPNTFQTPNGHVDEALEHLTGEETKCLLFAVRHIMGWQDRIMKNCAPLSLTMFCDGFTTSSGTHYGGTGLGRAAVINAVDELVRFGLLVKIGDPTPNGQNYGVGMEPDWEAIKARTAEKAAKNRERTLRASASRSAATPILIVLAGSSDEPPCGVPAGSSHDTTSGSSDEPVAGSSHELNQTHVQNQVQNQFTPRSGDPAQLALIPAAAEVKSTPAGKKPRKAAGEKKPRTRKDGSPTIPKAEIDPMTAAIVAAFQYDARYMTNDSWSLTRKAARELCIVKFPAERVPEIYAAAKSQGWTDFTPRALVTRLPDLVKIADGQNAKPKPATVNDSDIERVTVEESGSPLLGDWLDDLDPDMRQMIENSAAPQQRQAG